MHNLKSLLLEGELDEGIAFVSIIHPTLETLKFDGRKHVNLMVECLSLLDLFFGLEEDIDKDGFDLIARGPYGPSLNCPRLTSLHLSNRYSGKGILKAMASHAPNIKRLKSSVNKESPFRSHAVQGAL